MCQDGTAISLSQAGPSNWWVDFNYKSTVGGGRADLRIGGRSSDLLIGNQMPTARSQQIKSFHDPATTVLPSSSNVPGRLTCRTR